MTPRDRLAVMLVVLAAGIVLGMALVPVFRWLDATTSEKPVKAAPPPSPVPLLSLRCANGDPPRAWTQVELEGQMHVAIMARDTAMAQVWNPLSDRWSRIGQLTVDIVKLCRQGAQP